MSKAATRTVEKPEFDVVRITLGIVGTAPLLMNRYSDETDRPAKDAPPSEWAEYYTHRDGQGNVVFPSVAFKRAVMDAARCFDKSITGTSIKQNIHILGGLLSISFDKAEILTTWVRRPPKRGTPAMSHRPMFLGWRTTLDVAYNPAAFSLQQVLSIFKAAGVTVGVGAGRPGSDSGGIGMGTFDLELASSK